MTEKTRPLSARAARRARWAVPTVVGVVVAGAFVGPALVANADSDLPDLTPEQLLDKVAAAGPTALSGTAVYTARLGLPEIPLGDIAGADPVNLLGGSSTLRVWTDGTERSRVALLGATSEYSVVTDGPEAWTYSSDDEEVVHYTLSKADRARFDAMQEHARGDGATGTSGMAGVHGGDLPTPQEAGREALARAEQDATITVEAPTTVAGRPAYQVVVDPTSTTTLVDRIVVAVDARTWTPLRVQAWSTTDADAPALEMGFTDVSFASPPDSVLSFTSPPGASTRDVVVPMPSARDMAQARPDHLEGGLPDGVSVTGTGWDSVVELSDVDVAALVQGDPAQVAQGFRKTFGSRGAQELYEKWVPAEGEGPVPDLDTAALYDSLTTPVDGGRVLRSALLSVLVLDDGRVLVGAVPVDVLQDLAR
ncbi:LolA family protein [Cellulomonas massiliensis]|uniref:LolA family protein n=1 Tax=Cellulomonas massiliensis TaxID=1465811 RepID=UPI0002F90BA9|nr:hypothetical protein [Cellulomonas massiliensis]